MNIRLLLAVLAGALLMDLRGGSQTIPLFENFGTLTNSPQVDARAFANYGTFAVNTAQAYETLNTLNFTNRGTMVGSPGFRLNYSDDNGFRHRAASIVNYGVGSISGAEGSIFLGYSNTYAPTYLSLSATNLVNSGYLGVGNAGDIEIDGEMVDLSRGGLEVVPIASSFIANAILDTNNDGVPDSFYPDNAVYDVWWGTGVQDPPLYGPINTANILRFTGGYIVANSPTHWVTNLFGFGQTAFGTLIPVQYDTTSALTGVVAGVTITLTNVDGSFTNVFVPTNIFRQAVIVGVNGDTNISVRTRFSPGFRGTPFQVATVELSTTTTNVVAGAREVNTLYFMDRLGADTNTLILTNLAFFQPTGRPIAYEIWRDTPFEFAFGQNGNSPLFKTILYDTTMVSPFATNLYAGYAASVDYLEARPPAVPNVTVTNFPGRIDIVADTLDMSNTRVRGMGAVTITAKHLLTSAGALVDCENLAYNLSSTNGLLTIQNLSRDSVDRVNGTLYAWSGVWTNTLTLVLSNFFVDATTNYFSPVATNVDVNIHTLVLSADNLQRTQQVVVYAFAAHSTNVVFDDHMLVNGSALIDAEGFTQAGNLRLAGLVRDWTAGVAPRLNYFTNSGQLTVENIAYYGSDFPDGHRYRSFVNTGTLQAVGHRIAADDFQNSGSIQSSGDEAVVAGSAKLEGGRDQAQGDIRYYAQDLKLRNYTMVANRAVWFSVTNSLSDPGAGANNLITVSDGFHLMAKPALGDLLGTTFETTAPKFNSIIHTWIAADLGPTALGYQNNAAIGKLTLAVQQGGQLRFGPPGTEVGAPQPGNYALYVDYLNVTDSVMADLGSTLAIDPGMMIYFANANVPVSQLDGSLNGRLRWVKEFAGPNSSAPVASYMGGNVYKTIIVNLALLDSTTIDSDGDGVANAYDLGPFDGVRLTNLQAQAQQAPFTFQLSWQGAAQTVYHVEYTTDLFPAAWQPLTTLTNSSSSVQILTATDTIGANPPSADYQRYYRVWYSP